MSQSSENVKWWETTPLDQMSDAQWEALCDGCGKCCMVKIWHQGVAKTTKVGCELLNIKTGQCSDYANRHDKVKNCIKVTFNTVNTPGLLPDTCAYRLLKEGKALYDWHYLISGDRNTVISQGQSIVGFAQANNDQISAVKLQNYFLQAVDYVDQK